MTLRLDRRRAALLMLVGLLSPRAAAQPGPSGAIRGVISQQFEAFRAGELERAFGFASPGIREVFRTPRNFGRMVREGYPMVWRPDGWTFSELASEGGRLRQTVVITDAAGRVHVADYYMIETADGWRIDGVRLRPREGAGV